MPGKIPGMNDWITAAKSGRGAGNGYSRLKKRWTQLVADCAVQAGLVPIDRAYFEFVWHEESTRRDPDNITVGRKPILDGLVQAGILPDDRWNNVAGFRDEWRVADFPGVAVTIKSS